MLIVTDTVTYTNMSILYFKYINLRIIYNCTIIAPSFNKTFIQVLK